MSLAADQKWRKFDVAGQKRQNFACGGPETTKLRQRRTIKKKFRLRACDGPEMINFRLKLNNLSVVL